MGFKRTREEVCESLSGGMCDFMESEVLSVFYETTPEAVKELLPPRPVALQASADLRGLQYFP